MPTNNYDPLGIESGGTATLAPPKADPLGIEAPARPDPLGLETHASAKPDPLNIERPAAPQTPSIPANIPLRDPHAPTTAMEQGSTVPPPPRLSDFGAAATGVGASLARTGMSAGQMLNPDAPPGFAEGSEQVRDALARKEQESYGKIQTPGLAPVAQAAGAIAPPMLAGAVNPALGIGVAAAQVGGDVFDKVDRDLRQQQPDMDPGKRRLMASGAGAVGAGGAALTSAIPGFGNGIGATLAHGAVGGAGFDLSDQVAQHLATGRPISGTQLATSAGMGALMAGGIKALKTLHGGQPVPQEHVDAVSRSTTPEEVQAAVEDARAKLGQATAPVSDRLRSDIASQVAGEAALPAKAIPQVESAAPTPKPDPLGIETTPSPENKAAETPVVKGETQPPRATPFTTANALSGAGVPNEVAAGIAGKTGGDAELESILGDARLLREEKQWNQLVRTPGEQVRHDSGFTGTVVDPASVGAQPGKRVLVEHEMQGATVQRFYDPGELSPAKMLDESSPETTSPPPAQPLPSPAAPAPETQAPATFVKTGPGWQKKRARIQQMIQDGKGRYVPSGKLQSFAGEKWADDILATRKPTRPPSENAVNKKQDMASLKRALIEKYGLDIADTENEAHKITAFRDNRPELLLSDDAALKLAQGDDGTFSADDVAQSLRDAGHAEPEKVVARLIKRGILKNGVPNAAQEGIGQQDVSGEPRQAGRGGSPVASGAQGGDAAAAEVGAGETKAPAVTKFYEGTSPQQAGVFGQHVALKDTGSQQPLTFETERKPVAYTPPGQTAADVEAAKVNANDKTQGKLPLAPDEPILTPEEKAALGAPLEETPKPAAKSQQFRVSGPDGKLYVESRAPKGKWQTASKYGQTFATREEAQGFIDTQGRGTRNRAGAIALPSAADIKNAVTDTRASLAAVRSDIRPIGIKYGAEPAQHLNRMASVGNETNTLESSFRRRAFGSDSAAYAKFVELGLHYRGDLLNARNKPRGNLPNLTPAEVAARMADPKIKAAIALYNKDYAPFIDDIRTRNKMPMDPLAKSVPYFINAVGDAGEPQYGGETAAAFNKPFTRSLTGGGKYETDPIAYMKRVFGAHVRADANLQFKDWAKQSGLGAAQVTPVKEMGKPDKFVGTWNGRKDVEMSTIDLSQGLKAPAIDPGTGQPVRMSNGAMVMQDRAPDLRYVPKAIADKAENLRQNGTGPDDALDKFIHMGTRLGMVFRGAGHVQRNVAAVAARMSQNPRSVRSFIPSWLGNKGLAAQRMYEMGQTPLRTAMQVAVDRSGSARASGYDVPEAKSTLGKVANVSHDAIMHPVYGSDPRGRAVLANEFYRLALDQPAVNAAEKRIAGGESPLKVGTELWNKLTPQQQLDMGHYINTTMGFLNKQTRSTRLNQATRYFPFVGSESGMIPNELKRFLTGNVSAPVLKQSLARGQFGRAAVQLGGQLASGPVGLYLAMQGINYMTSKHFMRDNEEGHKLDVQLPGKIDGKALYVSNLDPGFARASRLAGVRDIANKNAKTPAEYARNVGRENVNELFSTIAPTFRNMLGIALGKEMYWTKSGEQMRQRFGSGTPIVGNTVENAIRGQSVKEGAVEDAGAMLGYNINQAYPKGPRQRTVRPPRPERVPRG